MVLKDQIFEVKSQSVLTQSCWTYHESTNRLGKWAINRRTFLWPPIDPFFMGREPSKIHNLDGTLIPINISYLTFWNILKPLETSFIPD